MIEITHKGVLGYMHNEVPNIAMWGPFGGNWESYDQFLKNKVTYTDIPDSILEDITQLIPLMKLFYGKEN